MHALIQEKSRAFVVYGESTVYFGSLALVSADNLDSLALGCFKESCTATRMCRHCMATKQNFKEHVSCKLATYILMCKIVYI